MSTPQFEANPGTLLTLRQAQVLFYMALGKTLEEIAIILSIARTTVKAHAQLLYAKFNAENRAQLITQAFINGYLRKVICLVLAAASFFSAVQPDNGADQVRNFRQARQSRTRKDKLHPSLWDFDHA